MAVSLKGVGSGGLAIALSITAGVLVLGCASDQTYPSVARPNLEKIDNSLDKLAASTSGAAPAPGAGETNRYAQQSQRDVDTILNGHQGSATGSGSDSQALPSAPPLGIVGPDQPNQVEGTASRHSIVWNDRHAAKSAGPKTAAPAVTAPTSVGGGSSSPQSPLFQPLNENTKSSNPANAATPPTQPTSRPALEPDRLRQLMVDLSRELYASGAYSDAPLRQLMMIAAMSMIDPDRRLDPQAIPDLTEKERDLLGKLQTFFAELGKSLDRTDDAEKSIVDAVAKLRESIVKEPQLKLATVALCTRVGGFGDFTEFDKRAFLAMAEQKAIVYLEIEDFTSQLNSKSEYVTEISQQLTIYNDRDGIPVWRGDWQAAVDVTKNKRQDFFTVQVVTLPKALSVGKYHMKVRVRDEKSGAEAENSIDFDMVADPKMAASVK